MISGAAAFLEKETASDGKYRPLYREMNVDYTPGTGSQGTIHLETPNQGESLLLLIRVRSKDEGVVPIGT